MSPKKVPKSFPIESNSKSSVLASQSRNGLNPSHGKFQVDHRIVETNAATITTANTTAQIIRIFAVDCSCVPSVPECNRVVNDSVSFSTARISPKCECTLDSSEAEVSARTRCSSSVTSAAETGRSFLFWQADDQPIDKDLVGKQVPTRSVE